jgi:hypothetical protein
MNHRERFRAAMRFQPTDKPCHVEHGFWPETYGRWRNEGLPSRVVYEADIFRHSDALDLFQYFGITKFAYVRPEQYYVPRFEPELIDETDEVRLVRNERGVLLREKIGGVSMPQFLEYPIQSRADYSALRDRLLGSADLRFPPDWDNQARFLRNQQDKIVGIYLDGPFAYPRELMGLECLLTTFYDDPYLIEEIIGDRVAANIKIYEPIIGEVRPDFVFIWEDMCYRNGPLISPAMFRKFLLPGYQRLTAFFRRMGIETIIVDSDGDVSRLIPLWLEGGVTGLLPFEVKSGMDVTKVRSQYPDIQIVGGIDKHRLELDHQAIDAEMERVLHPMLAKGGYCVALDHWVHSDIALGSFAHYVERVPTFGCGAPMP